MAPLKNPKQMDDETLKFIKQKKPALQYLGVVGGGQPAGKLREIQSALSTMQQFAKSAEAKGTSSGGIERIEEVDEEAHIGTHLMVKPGDMASSSASKSVSKTGSKKSISSFMKRKSATSKSPSKAGTPSKEPEVQISHLGEQLRQTLESRRVSNEAKLKSSKASEASGTETPLDSTMSTSAEGTASRIHSRYGGYGSTSRSSSKSPRRRTSRLSQHDGAKLGSPGSPRRQDGGEQGPRECYESPMSISQIQSSFHETPSRRAPLMIMPPILPTLIAQERMQDHINEQLADLEK